MLKVITVLFDNFETLDVFGPIEVLGRFPSQLDPGFYSLNGGVVTSAHKVPVVTEPFPKNMEEEYILFIPGGIGTRELVKQEKFIKALAALAKNAKFVLTVCTGAALLSKTGMLDGKKATSNKRAFKWVRQQSLKVDWVKKARWVNDGNIYTSSGVSAGIDMAFGFISDLLGHDIAMNESTAIEYDWKDDPKWDPFAELY